MARTSSRHLISIRRSLLLMWTLDCVFSLSRNSLTSLHYMTSPPKNSTWFCLNSTQSSYHFGILCHSASFSWHSRHLSFPFNKFGNCDSFAKFIHESVFFNKGSWTWLYGVAVSPSLVISDSEHLSIAHFKCRGPLIIVSTFNFSTTRFLDRENIKSKLLFFLVIFFSRNTYANKLTIPSYRNKLRLHSLYDKWTASKL